MVLKPRAAQSPITGQPSGRPYIEWMGRSRSLVLASDGDLIVERDPDRPSGRLLRQDHMRASYVDLADLRYLQFNYLRWTRLILRTFKARRVLHVGGAACTLARALLAEDPGSRQEVVELDQRVLDIARAHLGLRRQPGLKLRVGDGRVVVAAHGDSAADAIVIDAFLGAHVPRHLVTTKALSEGARVAPLTVVNVVDTAGWPEARAIASGLAEAYPHVAALCNSTRRAGNVVLFGCAAEPRYEHLQSLVAADSEPARLVQTGELEGLSAWRDA
jgi:protein-L-isoaspartate O-methyltransferase